jgi:hypothetical protein
VAIKAAQGALSAATERSSHALGGMIQRVILKQKHSSKDAPLFTKMCMLLIRLRLVAAPG